MSFHTTLELFGKTATGIRVPVSEVESLAAGKKPPVHVTINGYTYRSTIAVYGGEFYLPVSAEVRHAAGLSAGDAIDVVLALDTEPRTVTVPPDLAAALDGEPVAREAFAALSYSKQRGIVESIAAAKTEETRRRRIDKTLAQLRGG